MATLSNAVNEMLARLQRYREAQQLCSQRRREYRESESAVQQMRTQRVTRPARRRSRRAA